MPIKQVLTDKRVPVKIWTDEVDDNSKQQLANIASLPFTITSRPCQMSILALGRRLDR